MVSHDDVSAEDQWVMAQRLRALVRALLHGWELSRCGGSATVIGRAGRRFVKETFPMELRILLSIAAIYMALVGLGFIFAPQAIGIGAVPTDAAAALMAYLRLFGSPFLGIAVLNWTAR